MANLIDNCVINDEWKAVNRGHWSSGAGHTSTMNVFWNSKGKGSLTSAQYEIGYVIGTSKSLNVKKKKFFLFNFKGDESQDYFEGIGLAKNLVPQSLYLSQLKRRKKIDNIK
ncbi:MAG: hypothetical protein U9O87_04485, partial [Verrucomicrobiota bacterium]|nr:hypothetical protein [Verrucomicrobiota bacterium]